MSDPQGNPSRPVSASEFTREETYRATRLPVDRASTLIPDAYTSPEFHALERERIFGSSWVPVCVTDEVAEPGSFVVVDVGGRSLIVCRNRSGELRAHHNFCRHRGTKLCETSPGRVERFFQCPYHAWAYDLDGVLLGTPLFTPEAGIPADQEDAFDMSGVRGVRQGGLRPPSRARRLLGLPRVRLPRPGGAAVARRARRPADAAGRAPPRGAQAPTAGRVLDRGELEARRRELHGVLPPALGAPGARQGVSAQVALPLAGRRDVHGVLHDSDRREHRRRGLARASRALDAERGRPSERPVRVALPEHRAERAPQPHVPHAGATDRGRADRGDDVPALPSGVDRRRGRPTRGRGGDPDPLLGRGEPRGHRHRRAGAGRRCRHRLYRRKNVLPLRGVGAPLSEHGRRPDGGRSARSRRRRGARVAADVPGALGASQRLRGPGLPSPSSPRSSTTFSAASTPVVAADSMSVHAPM